MVYYKGIDYLQHAISHKRKFLNQCVLAEPHHLEHVDSYVHNGTVPDDGFQRPWRKVNADESSLLGQNEIELKKLKCCATENHVTLELFDSDDNNDFDHGVFDLWEFVPSSDPSSPELDDLQKLKCVQPNFKEEFQKEDLQKHEATADDNLKIEALIVSDSIQAMTKCLPGLASLKSCLHPNQVQDPIASKEQDIQSLFQHLEKIENLDNDSEYVIDLSSQMCWKEENCKYEIGDSKEYLEQCLSPPYGEIDNMTIETWRDVIKTERRNDPDFSSVDSTLNESLGDFSHGITRHLKEFEEIVVSQKETVCKTFLDMNGIGEEGDYLSISKMLLDMPIIADKLEMCDTKSYIKEIYGVHHVKSFKDVKMDKSFLNEKEKEDMKLQIWQHEKFFDDVIALRMQVPQLSMIYDITLSTQDVKAKLNLTPDEDVGKIELLLCWDALSFYKNMSQVVIAQFQADKSETPVSDYSILEQFQKHDAALLYDYGDMVMEIISKVKPEKSNFIVTEEKTCVPSFVSHDVGMDPLSDFLMMRGSGLKPNSKPIHVSKEVEAYQTKANVLDDSASISDTDVEIQKQNEAAKKPRRKSWKNKTIVVCMKGEFEKAAELINESASFYMTSLQSSGDILPSHKFSSLTPDITRFLMKQKEKQLKDEADSGDRCESYKAVVAVHALCGALDLLTNCCLESVLIHLSSMQEKFNTVLNGCLDNVRKRLWEQQCKLHEAKQYHPKLVRLYEEMCQVISHNDNAEKKVLVVLKRELSSQKICLKDFLSEGSTFKPKIIEDSSTESIIKSLDDFDCFIAVHNQVDTSFPWSQFSLVIEYETGENSYIKDLCQSQNINYTALEMHSTKDHTFPDAARKDMEVQSGVPVTVIGSRKLTSNPELLQLLETRYGLTLLERDYGTLGGKLHFADVVIDERTCILIHPLQYFSESYQLEPLITKILALSLKFATCWLIFYEKNITQRYGFCGSFVENVSRLHATMTNFIMKQQEFEIKVVICTSPEETAESIFNACLMAVENSTVWQQEDWNKRIWISEHISKEEKILLLFPCLNSFSAQLMLQMIPLDRLLKSSYQQLSNKLPWIPKKTLKLFCQLVNSDRGLGLKGISSFNSLKSDTNNSVVYDQKIEKKDLEHEPRYLKNQSSNDMVNSGVLEEHKSYNLHNGQKYGNGEDLLEIHMPDDRNHPVENKMLLNHTRIQEHASPNQFTGKQVSVALPESIQPNTDVKFPNYDVFDMVPACKTNITKQSMDKQRPDDLFQLNNLQFENMAGNNEDDDLLLSNSQTCSKYNEYVQAEIDGQQFNMHMHNSPEIPWNSVLNEHYGSKDHGEDSSFTSNIDQCHLTLRDKCPRDELPKVSNWISERNAIGIHPEKNGFLQKSFNTNRVDMENTYVKNIDLYTPTAKYSIENLLCGMSEERLCNDYPSKYAYGAIDRVQEQRKMYSLPNHNDLDKRQRQVFDQQYLQHFSDHGDPIYNNFDDNSTSQRNKITLVESKSNMHNGKSSSDNQRNPNHSFAKNLTQTTRNILRQAVMNDDLRNQGLRPPLGETGGRMYQGMRLPHRISVGLAQPLRREDNIQQRANKEETTDNGYEQNNQTPCVNKISNSPNPAHGWFDYDSPPMDLDFTPDLEPITSKQQAQMNSNQVTRQARATDLNTVFLPRKKSKLIYKVEPGSKGGQTKLAFK